MMVVMVGMRMGMMLGRRGCPTSVQLAAGRALDELQSVFNDAAREQRLQVFSDGLHAPGKRDHECVSNCACDRTRKRGERCLLER